MDSEALRRKLAEYEAELAAAQTQLQAVQEQGASIMRSILRIQGAIVAVKELLEADAGLLTDEENEDDG